jgi:hypothetical protein
MSQMQYSWYGGVIWHYSIELITYSNRFKSLNAFNN